MNEEVSKVKKEIRSVLITYPSGVSLIEFRKSYKKLVGEDLPTAQFGFNSDIDFLHSISDVVHLFINKEGKYQLFGIADETLRHIQRLVQKQKSSKSNFRNLQLAGKNNETQKLSQNLPFVPAILRVEINHVMKNFPHGITFSSFLLAYKKVFKKSLNLQNGLETLEKIISVLPELEIRILKNEKKIFQLYFETSESKDVNSCAERKSPHLNTFKPSFIPRNGSNLANTLLSLSEYEIDKSGVSNADREKFKKVFKLYPEGVLAIHFPPLYKKVTGEVFELYKLGYNSILELVDSLPDIFVRKLVPGSESNWILFPANLHEVSANEEVYSECLPPINERWIHNVKKLLKHYSPHGIKISDFLYLYQIYFDGVLPINDDKDSTVACFLELVSEWIPLKFKMKENSKFVYLPPEKCEEEVKLNFSKTAVEKFIPDDMANPAHPYMQPQLPADIKLSEYVPVFISSVINPSLFWFQLQTEEAIYKLRKLEKELDLLYNGNLGYRYKMNDTDVMIGASCVACCPTDGQWYRVVIKSVPSSNIAYVSYVDYGGSSNIPRLNLHYVRNSFLKIPAFAFEASLACLKPSNHESEWSIKSQNYFIQLCKSVQMMAQIEAVENGTSSIFLCDTNYEEDIHINDLLIHEGHAKFSVENDFSSSQRLLPSQMTLDSLKANNILTADFCSPCTSLDSSFCSDLEVFQDIPKKVSHHSHEEAFPYTDTSSSDTQSSEEESFQTGISFLENNKTSSLVAKRLFSQKALESNRISNRRYVKRLKLCDGCVSHIIVVDNKPFVSSGDISALLWGNNIEVLAHRLKFKEAVFPTVTVSVDNFKILFEQCLRYSVKGIQETISNDLTLTLYPLNCVIQILNIFGHPSALVRQAIDNETKSFDPSDPVWNDFSDSDDLDNTKEDVNMCADKLNKMCLYDLKAMYEGLNCKKLKILSHIENEKSEVIDKKVEKIENFQTTIARRMEDIEAICSLYS